jgi:hypothetical protein
MQTTTQSDEEHKRCSRTLRTLKSTVDGKPTITNPYIHTAQNAEVYCLYRRCRKMSSHPRYRARVASQHGGGLYNLNPVERPIA